MLPTERAPGSILTVTQGKFLEIFFTELASPGTFYLSGGTALSGFYLHHRYSDDLDFFTRDPEKLKGGRNAVERAAVRCELEVERVEVYDQGEGIKIFLAGDRAREHPLKNIDLMRDTEPIFAGPIRQGPMVVDALLNIAVNKVTTILNRRDQKDFVDLYYIINDGGFVLDDLFPLAKQKNPGFDEFYFAANLSAVDELSGLTSFLKDYMVRRLQLDELTSFCKLISTRIFERFPARGQ